MGNDIFMNLSGPMTLFLFAIGTLLLYLRFRARRNTLTAVQLWGITYLGLHFFVLGIAQLTWYIGATLVAFGGLNGRVGWDLNNLAPVFLLGFSLTFPRPIFSQDRLDRMFRLLFVALFVLGISFIVLRIVNPAFLDMSGNFIHLICWFGAIFFWLVSFEREPDPRTRTIVVLMIWGVLFYVFITRFEIWLTAGFKDTLGSSVSLVNNGLAIGLIVVVLGRLLWPTLKRLGRQTPLDRLQWLLLGMAFLMTALMTAWAWGPPGANYAALKGFLTVFSLSVLRPALMCYGLLRYNFFGPDVRVDRGLTLVGTLCIVLLGILIAAGSAETAGASPLLAGAAAGAILLVPGYFASKWMINRGLPPARTNAPLRRSEAREIYFLTLQTAVHRGKIVEPQDEAVLESLRKDLDISQREHALLLDWLMAQSPVARPSGRVQRAMLILGDGRMVAHAGPPGEGDADGDLEASMLVAIRGYVRDTAGKSSGELNTFKYGDRTMAVEHISPLVLATLHEGEPSPYIRLALLDELAAIVDERGGLLRKWDGVVEDVEPVRKTLVKLVDRYAAQDEGYI